MVGKMGRKGIETGVVAELRCDSGSHGKELFLLGWACREQGIGWRGDAGTFLFPPSSIRW